TGYRSPDLAYALGLAHGRLYQRALEELHPTGDKKRDAARRAEIERAHRDPALRFLKEARMQGAAVEAPEYGEGLIALYEKRFDDALALARKARERVSWLFEARRLEGDIHLISARDHYWSGNADGAREEFGAAGVAYRAVIEVARSDGLAYRGDCQQ